QRLRMRGILRPSALAGLTPALCAVERARDMVIGQHPTERLSGTRREDLHAGELQQRGAVAAPLLLRHDAEVVNGNPVESYIAHRALPHLEHVGMHQPITKYPAPAPGDGADWIRMLRRRKDVGQRLLARGTFQPGEQPALIRTRPADPYPAFLILHWRIMQLDNVEQLICNPVGSRDAGAAGAAGG